MCIISWTRIWQSKSCRSLSSSHTHKITLDRNRNHVENWNIWNVQRICHDRRANLLWTESSLKYFSQKNWFKLTFAEIKIYLAKELDSVLHVYFGTQINSFQWQNRNVWSGDIMQNSGIHLGVLYCSRRWNAIEFDIYK